ncbi:MAG: UPF0147 family protein [Candidatus Diapherotrites archaeon]|nr:UPF0147 family protein [Candidatus Diapherotrites archaeon]
MPNKEIKKEVEEIKEIMDEIIADTSVPRNIRRAIEEAKEKIAEIDAVNIGAAIYILDDISADINMPDHTRTEVWQLISMLEAVKEKVK